MEIFRIIFCSILICALILNLLKFVHLSKYHILWYIEKLSRVLYITSNMGKEGFMAAMDCFNVNMGKEGFIAAMDCCDIYMGKEGLIAAMDCFYVNMGKEGFMTAMDCFNINMGKDAWIRSSHGRLQ